MDLAEYRQIMRLYADVIDALKGWTPEDWRLVDIQNLGLKLFFHAASAYWLATGTELEGLLAKQGRLFDHSSVAVLARAALETFLTFHYLFVEPKSQDQFTFRYSVWQLSGFASREGFPARLREHQDQQEMEKELNEQLRRTIEQTKEFAALNTREKQRVLRGEKWRFASWSDIAKKAGVGDVAAEYLYAYLSSHAHSDALGVLQVEQADPRGSHELIDNHLSFISAIVAKMILSYAEKFAPARERLRRNPEAAQAAFVLCEALRKFESSRQSDEQEHTA